MVEFSALSNSGRERETVTLERGLMVREGLSTETRAALEVKTQGL